MPPPDNQHRCVCGFETPFWANMVGHRRGCDSWREHKAGNESVGRAPEPLADRAFPYDCPVEGCSASGSRPEWIVQHVKTCKKRRDDVHVTQLELAELDVDLAIVLAADARRYEDNAAFERWCQENERP